MKTLKTASVRFGGFPHTHTSNLMADIGSCRRWQARAEKCVYVQNKYCTVITQTYSTSFSLLWKTYQVHFCERASLTKDWGRQSFVHMYYQLTTGPYTQISVHLFPLLAVCRRTGSTFRRSVRIIQESNLLEIHNLYVYVFMYFRVL